MLFKKKNIYNELTIVGSTKLRALNCDSIKSGDESEGKNQKQAKERKETELVGSSKRAALFKAYGTRM